VKNHAPRRRRCRRRSRSSQHLLYIPWLSTYLPTSSVSAVKIAQSMTSKCTFAPAVHAIIDLPATPRRLLEMILPRGIIMAYRRLSTHRSLPSLSPSLSLSLSLRDTCHGYFDEFTIAPRESARPAEMERTCPLSRTARGLGPEFDLSSTTISNNVGNKFQISCTSRVTTKRGLTQERTHLVQPGYCSARGGWSPGRQSM